MIDHDTTEVTLVVPSVSLGEVYAFAATLYSNDEDPPTETEEEASPKDAPRQRAVAGFGAATVRKTYLGGFSNVCRPFLRELANNAGKWVEWTVHCDAIDRTLRQASGMLGAAERRCKQLPPYEKAYEDGQHRFRMPVEVADVVTELARSSPVQWSPRPRPRRCLDRHGASTSRTRAARRPTAERRHGTQR